MTFIEYVIDSMVVISAMSAGCMLGGGITAYAIYGPWSRERYVHDPFMIPEGDEDDLVEISVGECMTPTRFHKEA